MSGRFDVTTKLGLFSMHQPQSSLLHSLQPPFFTFSTCFWHFMSLGQHLLLVFMFSTPWVTFILKHFHFLVVVFVVLLLSLALFRLLHHFKVSTSIWSHFNGWNCKFCWIL